MSAPQDAGESAALIGHTGFVGGNLLRQRRFDALFNSANIDQIAGRSFDLVVCCGARAEKWKANADPQGDLDNIEALTRALERVDARKLVLISTVDVFADPVGVDEDSPAPVAGLHAYGRNRRRLEEIVAARFDALVVRLPALYGSGLKKNALYDLLHDNDLNKIDARGSFQFYDVGRLWRDVDVALGNDLALVHLPTEPTTVGEIARRAFGIDFTNELPKAPARYDIRTRFATLFGGSGVYVEDKPEVVAGISEWVAYERASRG
ncbi:MAG: NAD-dependent epimerase/dehydratase family protein [Gemmatimonadaceae bacterium]